MKKLATAIALLTIASAAAAAAYVGGNVDASSAVDPFWLYIARLWGGLGWAAF